MRKDKATRKAAFKAAVIEKLKSLIPPVIGLLVIVALALVIVLWPETDEEEHIVPLRGYSGDVKEYVLENDKLKFVMDAETTQFTLTVKETGKVWYSNPQGIDNDSIAFPIEKNKLRSTVLLTYSTINGVDTLQNNYDLSITNHLYEVEQGEDYIRIDYSIGDVEREYIIPVVMEVEAYDELMASLSGSEKNLVSQYYKKYDVNKLSKSDQEKKDELLERYPLMAEKIIYAIRDTANEAVKKKLETVFADQGYTYEQYLADKELDTAEKTTDKPVFNLSVIYRLDGGDFIAEIPRNSLDNLEDYPIYYVSMLPYFGAAGTTEEGFMFVPEGGGALIEYNNGKTAQNSYYATVYGWDMGQDRDAIVHETRTAFNVFGAATGDDSYICILEKGAPYAAIQADISGRNNSFNFINAVYTVSKREQYDVSDRYHGNMFVYEEKYPEDEIYSQRYRFVNSGDYNDMADAYRDYLFDKYEGVFVKNADAEAPVLVEVVGAIDKIKQILGVPVSRPLALTTFAETERLLSEMKENGMNNLSVKLSGWANGGVQQSWLNDIKPVKALGGKKGLSSLTEKAADLGVTMYLDGITNYAIDTNLFDGFLVFSDASRFISKEKAELYEYSTTSYGKRDDLDEYYLLKDKMIAEMMQNLADYASKYNASVSFQDIGMDLSSDFTKKAPVSREEVMRLQEERLAALREQNVLINEGNDYAVAFVDMIANMNLSGDEYGIIDKTIPFYQLALHGFVNYTGEALNLTGDPVEELLKSAEYGAGLNFTIMEESAFTLQNTLYTQYFGAEYTSCSEKMYEVYNRYNKELGHVFNQTMTKHEFIGEQLTCTTYEDGTKVYVNYSRDEKKVDGMVIPAKDYAVIR